MIKSVLRNSISYLSSKLFHYLRLSSHYYTASLLLGNIYSINKKHGLTKKFMKPFYDFAKFTVYLSQSIDIGNY